MGGGGSASKNTRSSGREYLAGKSMVDKFEITGTEKQVAYARDIIKRPFEFIESSIENRKKEMERRINVAKKVDSKRIPIIRKEENQNIKDLKDFGKDLTKTQYKPMLESKKALKASDVINRQGNFDGQKLYDVWKRTAKK